jgi:hypothetical protein
MPDILTLTCPTCGGRLQITHDIERFACAHCGNEHLVRRGTGVVTLAPVVESMDGLRRATDRTASELAIRRIQEDLAGMEAARGEIEARLAQGKAKLAEHDRLKQNLTESRNIGIAGVVLFVGYGIAESQARSQGNPDVRLFCAYPLLAFAAIGVYWWLVTIWRARTVDAVKPPRPEVEAAIQGVVAELEAHDSARRAAQAELERHRQIVRPDPASGLGAPAP